MLQSLGLQRVGHNLVAEPQQQNKHILTLCCKVKEYILCYVHLCELRVGPQLWIFVLSHFSCV